VIVSAVTAAIVATELAASGIGGFWNDHPMLAGVTSGLLLLCIAIWVVEGWVAEHGKPVVRQAYRSLAGDLGTLVFVMRWCVLGSKDRPDHIPVGTGIDTDCLRPVLDASRTVPPGGYWKRLKLLVRDDDWRAASVDVLRVCRRRLHEASSNWSAVMLTSPELSDDLSRVADLSEEIGRLNGALTDEDIADEVIGIWQELQTQAAELENRFYDAARADRLAPRHAEPYRPRRRRARAEAQPPAGG
jgi:hypothetical protein